MRQKALSLVGVFLLLPITLWGQIDKKVREFDEFVKQQQNEFDDFVDQQNKEFADFLKEKWNEYQPEPPVARPVRPEPVKPVVFNKNKPVVKPQEIKVIEVTQLPTVKPVIKPNPTPVIKPANKPKVPPRVEPTKNPTKRPIKKPVVTIPAKDPVRVVEPVVEPVDEPIVKPAEPPIPARAGMRFSFYGETCIVSDKLKNRLSLHGIAESDIARGWEDLCEANDQSLINDCLATKEELNLNDWGYLLLAEKVAMELCNRTSATNEVVMVQMFILCQSGYRAKVARLGSGRLVLLFATNDMIYAKSFLTIEGTRYFRFDVTAEGNREQLFTYNRDFANSRQLVGMNIDREQFFRGGLKKKELRAKAYPAVTVKSVVNEGLIAFYKDYPQCDFSVYVGAPVSQEVQQAVLPVLRAAIEGMKQADAANLLLNFVQTAFEYETDDVQFGYEKPFFIEELFYYPFCDCEDRSVLYSYLVRTLLGLDVVLLDYPGHVATAVRFTNDVAGDYISVRNATYVICDPTYVGADIGHAMPQYKNVGAKVLKY